MYDIEKIKNNIAEMAEMRPNDWDAICKGCGLCCLHKINVDGAVYFSRYACKHCDLKTKLCTKFQDRLSDGQCSKVNLRDVIAANYLPDTCAYVERIFGPSDHAIDINWAEIKQNPTNFNKIKTGIFKDSDSWAIRTSCGIIPKLLEFLDQIESA